MLRRQPKQHGWQLFSHEPQKPNEDQLNFIVNKLLVTVPKENHAEQEKFFKTFLSTNWAFIERLKNSQMQTNLWTEFQSAIESNNPERLSSIINRFKMPAAKQYEPPSVISSFLQTIAPFFVTSLFPSLALPAAFLSLIMPNLAQVTENININGGTPQGLDGICHGNCLQGWLSTMSEPVLARFNAIKEQTRNVNLGALWQLNRCVSTEKVGKIAAETFQTTVVSAFNDTQLHCKAQSSQIYGYQVTADLFNAPREICSAWQSNFPSDIEPCLDASKAIGLNVAISVMIMAGIAVLACCCAGAYYGSLYACNKCDNRL